jgi:hypothetical protein
MNPLESLNKNLSDGLAYITFSFLALLQPDFFFFDYALFFIIAISTDIERIYTKTILRKQN